MNKGSGVEVEVEVCYCNNDHLCQAILDTFRTKKVPNNKIDE